MKREFIPYEQALALKELGFNEDCFGCYTEKKEVIVRVGDYRSFSNNDSEDVIIRDFNSYENGTVSAPLYQQAFRWFREKYDLHPSFTRYKSSSINREPTIFTHLYEIQIIDENADKIFHVGDFNSLEEAELECLKKLIEIVKQK